MSVTMTLPNGHVVEGDLTATEGGFTVDGNLICGPHDDNGNHLLGSPLYGRDAKAWLSTSKEEQ